MLDTDEIQVSVTVFDAADDVREAWADPETLDLASVLDPRYPNART